MTWQTRITGYDTVDPTKLTPNPRNARLHPPEQQAALVAILDEVGWVTQIIVNTRTGYLLDGHLRLEQALLAGVETVPVVYVDLSETEETALLLLYDEVAGLALTDRDALEALLASIETETLPILAALDRLAAEAGIGLDFAIPDDLAETLEPETRSDVTARLGELSLHIPREVFDAWQETLYDTVGLNPEKITAEIQERLGL